MHGLRRHWKSSGRPAARPGLRWAVEALALCLLLVPRPAEAQDPPPAQLRDCAAGEAPAAYLAPRCELPTGAACVVEGTTLTCDLSRFDDPGCQERQSGAAWLVSEYGSSRNTIHAWGALFDAGGGGEGFCCVLESDRRRPVTDVVLIGTCGDDAALSFTYEEGGRRHQLDGVDLVRMDAQVFGGSGNDVVEGSGAENSRLYLETLHGEGGADRLYGREGNDVLIGGPGVDELRAGTGDDVLCDGGGSEVCDPGQLLLGGDGDDLLHVERVSPCATAAPALIDGELGKDRCGDPGWAGELFVSCRDNLAERPAVCSASR